MEIDTTAARRLALVRAGLLKPQLTDLPRSGRGSAARANAHRIIARFGYLQLDTVSIAGARSHALVLLSRLEGFDPALAEGLLAPGEPLFEYWGHEASWIPIELYSVFAFRRRHFRLRHPWWGDVLGAHPKVVRDVMRRIRDDGPLRSIDMEGRGSRGWWDLKLAKRVAMALWFAGELAIRERRSFQRTFDLTERVIPDRFRVHEVPEGEAIERLLLLALEGHGWSTTGTLARTWRLRGRPPIDRALARLAEQEAIVPCTLRGDDGKRTKGWIRSADRELADRLAKLRLRRDRGVLLSPFDPVLWDRERVKRLFGFDQILEIYKPAARRVYGYYCLPILAGERLVARTDLKADREEGRLRVLSLAFESGRRATADDRAAARSALERYARALGLTLAP